MLVELPDKTKIKAKITAGAVLLESKAGITSVPPEVLRGERAKAAEERKNPPPPPVETLSKLAIRRKLRKMGKEKEFDALLDATPHARADWTDAQEIRTDDPLFTLQKEAVKGSLGLSDKQFDEITRPQKQKDRA